MNDNDGLINQIQILVAAELATAQQLQRQNELAAETLAEAIRLRAAEQQRRRLAFDTQDMVAGLITALREVFDDIKDLRQMLADVGQKIANFDRRAERTDDILILLLTEHSPHKISEVRRDLEGEISLRHAKETEGLREAEKKELLETWLKNLAALRQQASYHGLEVPLHLMNQVREAEETVAKLKADLQ